MGCAQGQGDRQGAGDDFISLAGLALGVPRSEIYAMTGPTLKKAADYLRELKPFQISASSDIVTADAIRTGKAVVGQATSFGLAYRINEKAGKHVAEIKLPKEGALGWVDGPQLVKNAKNRDNAIKFIDCRWATRRCRIGFGRAMSSAWPARRPPSAS